MLYYLYCVEMKQSEESFYNSTLSKVIALLELHFELKYKQGNGEQEIVTSDINDFL